MKIRIGTRRSDLALWQARFVAARLERAGAVTELVELSTRGDRIDDVPLSQIEGKAFFTREIEDALLERRVDLAVHSHKDLPVDDPEGLAVVAVPSRGPIGERLLIAPSHHDPGAAFFPLRAGARVGTSAPRRAEQLDCLRGDLEVLDLRGNVPTRVERLRQGRYDAIVLAAAGLERLQLDLSDLVSIELPTDHFVPAPAQGALALQARADDEALIAFARRVLHDETTARVVRAERHLLLELGGGCSLPFGASVEHGPQGSGATWRLRAFLGRDHPHAGAPARWVETSGEDLDAVAREAARRLRSGEATGTGPLAGCRVALTGSTSRESRSSLGERLVSLGAKVREETVIEFEDVPCPALQRLARALVAGDGLAVTSREAARRIAGLELAAGVQVAAVGPSTARVLTRGGLPPQHVGTGGARELAGSWELAPGARVLFPCAENARRELEQELGARGILVQRAPLYRTVPRTDAALDEGAHVRVYMSPSAVEAAAARERALAPGPLRRIALGPTTGEALRATGLEFELPETRDPEAVVRIACEVARGARPWVASAVEEHAS